MIYTPTKMFSMNLTLFQESLSANQPPANLSVYLKTLWHDAKGEWNIAHQLIKDVEDKNANWIHAYLHRKEGDELNAGYWYRRAGKTMYEGSLEDEWEEIVMELMMV